MSKQEEAIKLFMENELILRDLYSAYSKKFPSEQGFWNVLVIDEENHAKIVKNLYNKVKDEVVFFDENRFKPEVLEIFNNSVKKELAKVESKETDLLTALSMAVGFEEALVEKSYFETFDSDVSVIKNTLKILKESSMIHLKYAKDKWDQVRSLEEAS